MKIQCTRHFLKRCKEQNLDPKDIRKCLKDEGLMIQGVVKWRLQNGIEIVVSGGGGKSACSHHGGWRGKAKTGDIRTKQNLQTGTVICHANRAGVGGGGLMYTGGRIVLRSKDFDL